MKTLLLGGTGVHLADILSSRGEKVFVTSRESSEFIEYIQGDAKNGEFFRRKMGCNSL